MAEANDQYIGTPMRMLGREELKELIELNPGTFEIPEEYAVVKKPTYQRSHSQQAAYPPPDLPPKRNIQHSASTKARPVPKMVVFNDLSASVGRARQQPSLVSTSVYHNGSPSNDFKPPRPAQPPSRGFHNGTSLADARQPMRSPRSPEHEEVFEEEGIYGRLSESSSGSRRVSGHRQLMRKSSEMTFPDDDIACAARATREETIFRRHSSRKEKGPESVEVDVFLTEKDNMLRGVLELSTLHHDIIDKVKLRVVFLIDVSGSMMLKCGRRRVHSKLDKLKKMAADVMDILEDGDDYIGVVTFGEETRVVSSLTKVDPISRSELKDAVTTVRSEGSQTDLVSGVEKAIDLLKSGSQVYDSCYHNAIIVFSDGEINSGVVNPDDVVHNIRQRIRDTNPLAEHPNRALWINVACVTTGGNVSEAMYLVSKHCGNDAYYYVDSDLSNPEVDMLVPLLQRKAAIAQFITIDISSDNGAKLIEDKCTREFSVRRRTREKKTKQMVYYLHDLQAGSQRHFSLVLDLTEHPRSSESNVMVINMEYVDTNGETHNIRRTVRFADSLTPLKDPEKYDKGVLLSAKADMRSVFQNACRDAADLLQNKGEDSPAPPLDKGKENLHRLMEQYGMMAKREETKAKIAEFSRALIDNLDKLLESMEKSRRGDGHKWTKIKAVSSAVVRETPTVSNLVAHSESICPLPVFKSCKTTRTTALALKLYRKQEVTSVVFPNQNLFDAAKVVMQNLGDIVKVLNEVEAVPKESQTLRRNIISSMVILEEEREGDSSD